ncbi:MAG: polyprenyl synthetase family protein [Clostridia bacterium]|nr:polyprenyl synthetase family protein [Clostridia bacterium]
MVNSIFDYYKPLIEDRIDYLLPETEAAYNEVVKAARYSLKLGGKRIRPIIMMEFCRLFGGESKDALDFAVALEMIHTYSLIHDDLPCMDNDDFRRGKPSCHKAFSEDMALLAGDALLTEAFTVAANAMANDSMKIKAVSTLSQMAGFSGMLGGQVIDLSFVKNPPDLDSLCDMYALKTGCLLRAATIIGAICGGANETEITKADLYAQKVGLAFQIIDDILDVTADPELLGKPVGSDDKNQKTTFVGLLGLDGAKAAATKLTNEALEIINGFSGDTENIKALTSYLLDRNF